MPAPQNTGPDARSIAAHAADTSDPPQGLAAVASLRRLTDDRYADLHPVWSPDGTTIAFASDRGPDTDFGQLKIGNMRICTLDLATGLWRIRLSGSGYGEATLPSGWTP